jgi:response regulator of citrate/malate metabolism
MKINKEFYTISEISECLKLSRITISRYLKYLYSVGEITKKI